MNAAARGKAARLARRATADYTHRMTLFPAEPHGGRTEIGTIRRVLVALVILGAMGLIAELLLLEHYETAWQYAPIALLVFAMVTGTVAALRPSHTVLRIFQSVMVLCVASGLVGVFLHYQGNVEWEIERNAAMRGWELFREAMMGATPALAPGAMAQLGLVGLAFAWRHPVLRPSRFSLRREMQDS